MFYYAGSVGRICFSNVHFQLFFFKPFLSVALNFAFAATLVAREGLQSDLCVDQSHGPVCLASLMSTAEPLNMVLTFSHINVAEVLTFSNCLCMHALLMHTDS